MPLSPREREIVLLFSDGLTAPQIAAQLHIAVSTVRTHLENARARNGVHNSRALVRVALAEEE